MNGNTWEIESWSNPDEKMVYVVITDGNKRICKNYSQRGSFLKFMWKYGIDFDSYWKIVNYIWG